jgi:hypothetical protein
VRTDDHDGGLGGDQSRDGDRNRDHDRRRSG